MPATSEVQSLSASETAAVRKQLELLMADDLLRTSKRSVAFLRYIVEETLLGRAEELKERTIGVNVFGKALTYDTNLDHVVRTAASELRKRLALYYGKDSNRQQLRIVLIPGSYVPQFQNWRGPMEVLNEGHVTQEPEVDQVPPRTTPEPTPRDSQRTTDRSVGWRSAAGRRTLILLVSIVPVVVIAAAVVPRLLHPQATTQQRFWKPFLESNGPVLLAVGDVPGGPPIVTADDQATPAPARTGPPAVPFADVVTIARVSGILSSFNKEFLVRQENSRSFADLREGPVVFIGAFNNEWSLQLIRNLRFTLAVDPLNHLLYIRDREHPDSRAWAWNTGPHPDDRDSSARFHDYALVTRILDSETGHDVMVMGGLYAYGTQAAGEFLASREMYSLDPRVLNNTTHKTLQIVLETTVTDGSPGPPHIVAVSQE